ncbi:hypothetical protein BZK25_03930 [Helicobacter pylori]|nr:hypothetical protein BZK25_03930 [Helicobacter pylori]
MRKSLAFRKLFLNVKNTQRHQLIANTPLNKTKNFHMLLYEMRWNVLRLFYHGSIRHYILKIFA